jgi:hypothetical protein
MFHPFPGHGLLCFLSSHSHVLPLRAILRTEQNGGTHPSCVFQFIARLSGRPSPPPRLLLSSSSSSSSSSSFSSSPPPSETSYQNSFWDFVIRRS